jgi:carotenoid cleavage dioxygenase-like enzyme
MTVTSSPPTIPYAAGLETQERETVADALPVEGTIPPWLAGSLIRTGPAKFEVGERQYRHWFDGLAMLHRFGIAEGRVSYANRFLETRAFKAARDYGRISYSEFATDPCRTLFQRFFSIFSPALTDNAAVNLVRLGEQFVAMTETPLPMAFEADTLKTLGVTDWAKGLKGQITTAHPHLDRERGELVNYVAHLGPTSRYRVYALAPGSKQPRQIAAVRVNRPAYMHSFAITERYVVLVEFPLVVVPIELAVSGRPFIENYRWEPKRGTRFTVIDLGTGKVRARVDGPAFFSFHHINAFEDGDELVIDLCAYEDASIIQALYLDRLRAGEPVPTATPWRYCVPLNGGEASGVQLADVAMELPRIDYRKRNARPYRYVYGAGARGDRDFLNQLVKVDVEDGSVSSWSEPGSYPGEPVFVPAPDQKAEDDGAILSVVLDSERESSFLLVFDAHTFQEVARAQAPLRIPFGFHGSFFSA